MGSGDKKKFEKGTILQTDSASLIALAAEVAKHDEKFQRIKAAGGIRAPRSIKKPTVWQRQNPGLAKRVQKQDAMSPTEADPEGESARRVAMERKAKMYELLKRGEDVPDRLREELLVEFEYKNRDRLSDESDSDDGGYRGRSRSRSREREFRGRKRQDWESGRRRSRSRSSDWDRDESLVVARNPKDLTKDPWVEHIDEFGRTRLMRQSEIPRPETVREEEANHVQGIHNPANPFPIFRKQDSLDKQEWIRDATGELTRSGSQNVAPGYSLANTTRHYDNATERRARGVGFYAFSQDDEERAKQMRELREIRSETENRRAQYKSLQDRRRDEIVARKKIIQQKRLKSLASTITVAST
ncbi:hypothetical protein BC939DRAFT_464360 [Gamsiella multidivaricata]|uniref:uncharacterized protein n=1 Tax=Gamsiella multidivaricata TaxID=101098 RepID=UPI0022210150|nr:uncharacterized protein BC939DRAFT_464360 [Gamsiella multidivaricata]KAI7817993.1 hypothetical protein BC939DRAFT_464360 [Gamsiella multidivaricata]